MPKKINNKILTDMGPPRQSTEAPSSIMLMQRGGVGSGAGYEAILGSGRRGGNILFFFHLKKD